MIKNRLFNKSVVNAIVLILLLAMSAVAMIPIAFAKTYTAVPDRETGTVVGISPTHVGFGSASDYFNYDVSGPGRSNILCAGCCNSVDWWTT